MVRKTLLSKTLASVTKKLPISVAKTTPEVEAAQQKLTEIYDAGAATSSAIPDNWEDFAASHKIRSALSGYVDFHPWALQVRLWSLLCRSDVHSISCTKTRQIGYSETTLSIALLLACLGGWPDQEPSERTGLSILVVSKRTTDALLLSKRLRDMMRSLESPPELLNDSLGEYRFANGSRIRFGGPDSGRSESFSLVIADEFSFFPKDAAEEFLADVMPAITLASLNPDSRDKILFISTPNGTKNEHHRLLCEGNEDDGVIDRAIAELQAGKHDGWWEYTDPSGWVSLLVHWFGIEPYRRKDDELKAAGNEEGFLGWIRETKKLSKAKTQREFNLDHSETSTPWLAPHDVENCIAGAFLSEPEENWAYYYGLDCAGEKQKSRKSDYAVLTIIGVTPDGKSSKVAATVRSTRTSFERNIARYVPLIEQFGCVAGTTENNHTGGIYHSRLSAELAIALPDCQCFFVNTSGSSRPVLLERIAIAIEGETITYPASQYSIEIGNMELDEDGRIDHPPGLHDDCVFSLAMSLDAIERYEPPTPEPEPEPPKKTAFAGRVRIAQAQK